MATDWKSALGSLLPDDYKPEEEQSQPSSEPKQSDPLRIEIDRKRSGKTATIISGFTISNDAVADLTREIKQRLGAGGSCRGGEILIQGDRREAIARLLTQKGYKTKIIN